MSIVDLRMLSAVSRQISTALPHARDLELLGHIEKTADLVADMTVKFESMALIMEKQIEIVQKATFDSIEELEELERPFAGILELTEQCYEGIVALRQSAIEDARIKDEDGIVEAYDALLEQTGAYHNNLSNLAWLIGEHIAEADEVLPGKFTSAAELAEAMGA